MKKHYLFFLISLVSGLKVFAQIPLPAYMDYINVKAYYFSPYKDLIYKSGAGTEDIYKDSAWFPISRFTGSIDIKGNYSRIIKERYNAAKLDFMTEYGYVSNAKYGVNSDSIRNYSVYDSLGEIYNGKGTIRPVVSNKTTMYYIDSILRPTRSYSGTADSLVYNPVSKLLKDRFISYVDPTTPRTFRFKTSYAFNAKNQLDSIINYSYNSGWVYNKKTKYKFTDSGAINMVFIDSFYNNNWNRIQTDSFFYNASNKCIRYVSYQINGGSLVGFENHLNSYTDSLLTEVVIQKWISGAWINVNKRNIEYINGSPLTLLIYKWMGSTYETNPSGRISWLPIVFNGIPGCYQSPEISIYPNPVQETLHLTGIQKPSECLVYDLTGKEQMKVNFDGITNPEITVNGLPKGVYLIRISTGNESTVLKFIKD